MGSGQSKKAQKSIQAQKIKELLSFYGYKSGPSIQNWLNSMYSPSFYGVTIFNYGQPKQYQNSRQTLPGIYERAHKGNYRSSNLTFQKVDTKSRTIYYKWINNTPHKTDESRRIDIPFQSCVMFDENYRILKAVHNHCPAPKKEIKQVQSERPGYWQKSLDRAQKNMQIVNQLLSQNYYPDTTSSNQAYEQSQRRFRQNKNKQAREYNNWVRSQQNRYY